MSTRITYVFPSDGSEPYVKGTRPIEDVRGNRYPTIQGDLPDFVSPIDGRLYSGRAGLREHCIRHDVVPNADLKGLPMMQTNSDFRRPEDVRRDRAARKEQIIHLVNQHYR